MWWDEWDIGDGTIGQRYGATVKNGFIEYSIRWS
jgi:thymidylate synthase